MSSTHKSVQLLPFIQLILFLTPKNETKTNVLFSTPLLTPSNNLEALKYTTTQPFVQLMINNRTMIVTSLMSDSFSLIAPSYIGIL